MKCLVSLLWFAAALAAQPTPASSPAAAPSVISPEVHPDRTVTFRFYSPGAKEVLLTREWGPPVPMQRDGQNIWSLTTEPLEPDYYGYSFVADGVGLADPKNLETKTELLRLYSMVHVPGPASLPWESGSRPHGAVHHHFYSSPAVGDNRDYFVYTPPGYETLTGQRYPVLYLFHGAGEIAPAWTTQGRANFILDNLIAQGKAKPMIVVMPLGYGAPELAASGGATRDPAVRDRGRKGFREALFNEIIPQVEQNYRVLTDRRSRAIAGLSMGGTQSLYTGLNALDRFAWIGAFSAGLGTQDYAADFPKLDQSANRQIDLLWVACGTEDTLIAGNRQFREWLKSRGVRVTEIETPGIHSWMVFRRSLAAFAPLLFR